MQKDFIITSLCAKIGVVSVGNGMDMGGVPFGTALCVVACGLRVLQYEKGWEL